MSALPFGLESWYPVVAGPLHEPRVIGEDGPLNGAAVHAAWSDLKPGRALVVIDRTPRLLRPGRMPQLLQHLPHVERHHHWRILPGTGGSQTLLPADPAGFRGGVSLLPAGRARWRLVRQILRFGARATPLLGLDDLHVLARVGDAPGLPAAPHLRGHCTHAAVSLGVPGYHRKAVARALDSNGRSLGVVKVPMTEAARSQISHEDQALRQLERLAFPGSIGPRHIDGEPGAWLHQEDLQGKRSGDELDREHLELLERLAGHTHARLPLLDIPLFGQACERLEQLRGAVDPAWWDTYAELATTLRSAASDAPLTCGQAHGDFTPWNLMCTERGLRAYDWEFSQPDAPALFDLAHFHLQTGVLVKRQDALTLVELFDSNCAGAWAGHLTELEVRRPRVHLGLYLLHQATFDEQLYQLERPPFEQVDWLWFERLEMARLLTDALAPQRCAA